MLNKEICKQCSYSQFPDSLGEYAWVCLMVPLVVYDTEFNLRTDQPKVTMCSEIPKYCPFQLEHVVSGEK